MSTRPTCSELGLAADGFGVPAGPGVYAIVACATPGRTAEHVLYVGASANMRKRLHHTEHPFHRITNRLASRYTVAIRCMVTTQPLAVERRAIKALRPLLNTHHNG